MSDAELATDLAQVSWLTTFILAHGGVADDPQIRNPGQIRQDLILHAVCEVRVLFIVTQIFKRQNRDRFCRTIDRCVLRRGSRVATEKKQSNRYERASNYHIKPGTFFVSGCSRVVNFFGALEPLRRQLERPSQTKRNRQTQYDEDNKQLNDPDRNGKNR